MADTEKRDGEGGGRVSKLLRRLGPVGPIALVSATLPGAMGLVLLANISALGEWLRSHYGMGALLFIAGYAVTAGFPLLPTYAITALGGWAFGFELGFIVCMLGYIAAMLLAYGWLQWVIRDRVVSMLHHYPKWAAVRKGLVGQSRGKTIFTIALLRLPPNVPFALINIVLVSAKVRFSDYLLGSFIGVLPRTAALVYVASSLEKLTSESLKSSQGPAWLVGGIAVTVVVFAIITVMANRAIQRLGTEPVEA